MAALEKGIPLEERPFSAIACRLGMDEDVLLDRVRALIASGAIRRLAALFDSRSMGFASTLVAARPGNNCFEDAVALVNSFDEVTHNYRRAGAELTLWFTLVGTTRRIGEILESMRESGLFEYIEEMPATEFFKVRTQFAGPQDGKQNGSQQE